jgi:hypothetical protein
MDSTFRCRLARLLAKIFSPDARHARCVIERDSCCPHELAARPLFSPATEHRTYRKPIFHGLFRASQEIRSTSFGNLLGLSSRAWQSRASTQHMVSMHMRARWIKRKCWFFYCAVVIRMQCSRSPRALTTIATHSWLGGQHGEEAKDEDEVSGEKGSAQDKAPEEEVRYSPLPVFDFERCR